MSQESARLKFGDKFVPDVHIIDHTGQKLAVWVQDGVVCFSRVFHPKDEPDDVYVILKKIIGCNLTRDAGLAELKELAQVMLDLAESFGA